jgi:type II secretory pathway pseudopilin PulG
MTPRRLQAGFGLIEMAFVAGITATLLVLFGQSVASATRLQTQARASLRAEDDCRRSLAAISHAVRNAHFPTVVVNTSTRTLSFQRVEGFAAGGPVLGPVETVSWRSAPADVPGVSAPGEVVLTRNGVAQVLAPRVPRNGVYFWRIGTTVRVMLQTWGTTSEGRTSIVTRYDSATIRN